ncbi:MAG: hypothetical protein K2P86_05460 [Xanthobacteraceae bacterium]|nr:hypothetical protein [Xanthobacteraceae bacterium]
MPITEKTSNRLVLLASGATLTLDKQAKKATLQRKGLLWKPKPLEADLADVTDTTVDTGIDRASGVEISSNMLVFKNGGAWALYADNKKDAEATAAGIRDFLGLKK